MIETRLADAVAAWLPVARQTADAEMERDWFWRGVEADARWAFFRTYEDLLALADSIAAARIVAGRAASDAQRALGRYHAAHRELQALLLRAGPEDFDRAPAPGEWPLRDVLGHIMRGDAGFVRVARWALDRHRLHDDQPLAVPEDAPASAADQARAAGTMTEALDRWASLHARVLDELAGTPDGDLAARVSWWYEADVRFQFHRFDAHLREHTIQAEKVLQAILPPATDAWRTLQLIYRALGEAEGAALGAEDLADPLVVPVAAGIRERAGELLALAGTIG